MAKYYIYKINNGIDNHGNECHDDGRTQRAYKVCYYVRSLI